MIQFKKLTGLLGAILAAHVQNPEPESVGIDPL